MPFYTKESASAFFCSVFCGSLPSCPVLFSSLLFSSVLFCPFLYYLVLSCPVLYYSDIFSSLLFCPVLLYFVQFSLVLFSPIPCYHLSSYHFTLFRVLAYSLLFCALFPSLVFSRLYWFCYKAPVCLSSPGFYGDLIDDGVWPPWWWMALHVHYWELKNHHAITTWFSKFSRAQPSIYCIWYLRIQMSSKNKFSWAQKRK